MIYGLVFITPIAPVAVFGIVFNASRGMVPLVYVIGLIAMIFIAFSYMSMSTAFPVAGSVYTYAARSLGRIVGFFAGWAMLLDYILLPTLIYVVSAIAVQAVFPEVPKALVIVAMVAVTTLVNYLGIETTARTSFVLLAFQLALLALLAVLGGIAVAHHVAGASVSVAPFYNPALVTPGLVFGALSLAVLSFLGFDAISTLSEESLHGAPAIGRATMVSLCLSAALFIGQTWIASLFVLGRTSFPPGTATDGAYYEIAALIGGPAFKFLLAVPGILLSSLAGAITAQAATARLLFGMARDGELPRALAYVEPKRKVPERTVFLVAGVTLITGLLLAEKLELLTSMVNFGALVGFLLLQVSVFVHFVVRNGSRNWLRHAVIPATGFCILVYVLWNAEANAKIAGIAWLAVGLAVFLGLALQRRTATR